MFKVLLPLDITHPVDATVKQVESLVPLADKEVHVLYVNEAWPAYENVIGTAGDFADDWRHKLESKAKDVFSHVAELLKGKCASFSSEIVTGPPAMMIESVSRDEHIDLTAVSPGKHTAVEQFFIGSVSAAVVKHCRGIILVCRGSGNGTATRNVVIGLDGSPNSKEALKRSIDVFALKNSDIKISLVHAVDVADPVKFISPIEFISSIEQNLLMEGEQILADGKRTLADHGIKNVDMLLKPGKPAKQILEAVDAVKADLLIVGAEGRTAVQHFLMGSVSQRVSMHASCPVAVFKRQYSPS